MRCVTLVTVLVAAVVYSGAKVVSVNISHIDYMFAAETSATILDVTVTQFCYSKNGGKLSISGTSTVAGQQLLFFDDSLNSYPAIVKSFQTASCQYLGQYSKNITVLYGDQLQGLGEANSIILPNGAFQYGIKIPASETHQPTYWYMLLSNCQATSLGINATVSMFNPGGFWTRQFSVDEQGLLGMYEVYVVVSGLLCVFFGWIAYAVYPIQSSRMMVSLSGLAIALTFLATVLNVAHGTQFGVNGIGLPAVAGLAELCENTSNLSIMFVFLCVAKGWTIDKPVKFSRIWLLCVGVLIFVYILLFFIERALREPGQNSCYQNNFGIFLSLVRVAFYIYFVVAYRALQIEDAHKFGYRRFFVIATAWFMVLPFFLILSPAFPIWTRVRVLVGTYYTVHLLTLFILALAIFPFRRRQPVSTPTLLRDSLVNDAEAVDANAAVGQGQL